MKSFNRTWNTRSRILTAPAAQGMNSKRWLAPENWSRGWNCDASGRLWGPMAPP